MMKENLLANFAVTVGIKKVHINICKSRYLTGLAFPLDLTNDITSLETIFNMLEKRTSNGNKI